MSFITWPVLVNLLPFTARVASNALAYFSPVCCEPLLFPWNIKDRLVENASPAKYRQITTSISFAFITCFKKMCLPAALPFLGIFDKSIISIGVRIRSSIVFTSSRLKFLTCTFGIAMKIRRWFDWKGQINIFLIATRSNAHFPICRVGMSPFVGQNTSVFLIIFTSSPHVDVFWRYRQHERILQHNSIKKRRI